MHWLRIPFPFLNTTFHAAVEHLNDMFASLSPLWPPAGRTSRYRPKPWRYSWHYYRQPGTQTNRCHWRLFLTFCSDTLFVNFLFSWKSYEIRKTVFQAGKWFEINRSFLKSFEYISSWLLFKRSWWRYWNMCNVLQNMCFAASHDTLVYAVSRRRVFLTSELS